jgi:phthalate 4,5-dioxygenase oxygenase subunit
MSMTQEVNERLTHVGPGTPMGEVFRRYWIPACLTEEIPEPDCPPARVRLLGEDLVAFRDSDGVVGLIDAFCAHRRAPLFFGRNEECGIRCVYHGWKFDTLGNCVDTPSEPPQSKIRLRASITAYPVFEAGGVVWTYMGPTDQMPPQPDFEWLRIPSTHLGISKTNEACNFLQAIEGGIDTAHSSFLHNNDLENPRLLRSRDPHPTLEVDVEEYGFRYGSIRNISDEESYIRIYQFIMPNQQMRANLVDGEGNPAKVPTLDGHVWVPIDDHSVMVINIHYASTEATPISHEDFLRFEKVNGRHPEDYLPDSYWLIANGANNYLVDRDVQRTKTFTGIAGINTQDFAIQEGMGQIVDRSLEVLGSTDKAISTARQLFAEAMDEAAAGRPLRGTNPDSYRDIRAGETILARGLPWRDATKGLTDTNW